MRKRPAGLKIALLLTVALLTGTASGRAQKRANMNLAEARFRLGEFAEAGEIATAVLLKEPDSFRAALLRGKVALLDNRLSEAEEWVRRATELRPSHRSPREILAEIHYRRDEFAQASTLLAELGKDAKAAKLASFADLPPYASTGTSQRVTVAFEQTDPLPVVRMSVNGSEPAAFIIDTGGGEVILDREWAREIGVTDFGSEKGTFGGGKKASYGHGRADTLSFGALELANVPVQLLDTTPFSAVAPGENILGVLGTVLLYHFRSTIDYPGGRLILEPRIGPGSVPSSEATEGLTRVPFSLAGDHFIIARGSANDADPALFFVDTGLAGLGFTCPQSTLDEAGVELVEAAVTGVGGGGAMSVTPFLLESLRLGMLERRQIPGVFGPFPPTLEHSHGFRLAGLVSHGFFRPYAVTLDFDAMELVIRQP